VNEGPRVYIERIEIVGNVRTLDVVIRREMRLVEGDAYNRVLVDRARRRITALDFFNTVDIQEQPGSSGDKVVLIVQVDEKSTGQLNFGAGFSTTEAILGTVSLSERNLLGRGQFVRLATSLSFKRQQLDFSFTEPYFLDRRIRFGVDAFSTETNLQSESSFDSRQIGGGLRFGFPVSENSSVVFRYNFTNRNISDVDGGASPAIAQAAGTTNISTLGLSWAYDTLDSPLNPTNGFRLVIDQDLAGLGGDVFFWRLDTRATYFYSPWESIRLMLRGTGGYIGSLNDQKVDIIDRFFKGGETFRGFERSGIGPRDLTPGSNGDALGGQAYLIGTAEVSFPVGLPEEFGVRGALFTDVGTIFEAHESSSNPFVVGFGPDLRASVGVSVLWSSPLGPLRFDLAYPVVKEKFDQEEFFRFSAGARF
jgi:outer membrane protein insertion porin family